MEMAGIYIHIPFCKSRCIYCGFYSTTLHDLQDRYVDNLVREFKQRKDSLTEPVETIYLGGGTPSQLSLPQLRRLFEAVMPEQGEGTPYYNIKEVTMECNPDDVTAELAQGLRSMGVTRVSMGAQTFSDERLRFLHRRHTAQQVRDAVSRLREAGIRNISIDLMFGFPGETLDEWTSDIDEVLSLDVEHISAYSLMYEEGTPLYRMLERGEIEEIDEELSRQMYYTLIDKFEAAGYEHYEISNFAKPGYRSRHNSSYWHDVPYLGLGAGAHSYDKESRQHNGSLRPLSPTLLQMGGREYLYEVEEVEELDEVTKYNDMITTALRTREGIEPGQAFLPDGPRDQRTSLTKERMSNIPQYLWDYMMEQAKPLIEKGLLAFDNNHLHLTREGLYVSDDVMSELIYITADR